MDTPEIFTQFHRPPYAAEENSGELITETEGYVPANILIENMIAAGQRLDYERSDYYQYGPNEEVPDDAYDPFTKPGGLDPAEADALIRSFNGRIAEQKALWQKEQAARAAAAAAQSVPSAPDVSEAK